ncbi:hypothetical protein BBC0122_016070 [Bartonella choladocola]|uniref:Uncharacterized protein n=1 Tax=Bartonella choladocola TaxID=2750995 RepID=A0A1U9MJ23_9HYPH|nr:hypothetical protein BBC0122_016070 [Bartonella choladocola]
MSAIPILSTNSFQAFISTFLNSFRVTAHSGTQLYVVYFATKQTLRRFIISARLLSAPEMTAPPNKIIPPPPVMSAIPILATNSFQAFISTFLNSFRVTGSFRHTTLRGLFCHTADFAKFYNFRPDCSAPKKDCAAKQNYPAPASHERNSDSCNK